MAKVGETSSDTTPARWGPKTDCPLYAMRFTEDLINYVWEKLDLKWPVGNRVCQRMKNVMERQVFISVVGDAVFELIGYNIKLISKSYKKLLRRGIETMDDFRREACLSATFYFPDGYDHERFLIFSSSLVGVSIFYFVKGNSEIADASAQLLSYMLNFYIYQNAFDPASDWFKLCVASQDIRRSMLQKELKFRLCDFTDKRSTL